MKLRGLRWGVSMLTAVLLFCAVLTVSALALDSAPPENTEFLKDYTALLQSRGTSHYFSTMTLTPGDRSMRVDGSSVALEGPAEMVNGRLMVPLRAIAEIMGAEVTWEPETRAAVIRYCGEEIRCVIGADRMTAGSLVVELETPAYLRQDLTYLPVRAVCEALCLDVFWDAERGCAVLSAPYQTARLLVLTYDLLFEEDLKPVALLNDGLGMWVVQYASPLQAVEAERMLKTDGTYRRYPVVPDLFVSSGTGSGGGAVAQSSRHQSWGANASGFDGLVTAIEERFPEQERVAVAVVDTGVDASHPALAGRVLTGRDMVDNDSDPADTDSHGTHVAGIILDCVGDAPVDILPIRVLDDAGNSFSSRLASGIKYAADRHAAVINLSLGGALSLGIDGAENLHAEIDDAIRYAVHRGSTVVVSAGNGGTSTRTFCPSHLDVSGVLVVTAADQNGAPLSSANYGENLDLLAPGENIRAAVPGGGYAERSGSSEAVPHVSAAAALLALASGNSLTPTELERVVQTATAAEGWQDAATGRGMLDLSRAAVPEFAPPAKVKNVLASDRIVFTDPFQCYERPVFGSALRRDQIGSVTFQDTLTDMPAEGAWDVSEAKDGSVMAWTVKNGQYYDLFLAADGPIYAPQDCSRMFFGYRHTTSFRFQGVFHTETATDMNGMFKFCHDLPELDLSEFDTSHVRDMGLMFNSDWTLTSLDLSGFDTSRVTNLYGMFYNCGGLVSLNLDSFNTAGVTDFRLMFTYCEKLHDVTFSGFSTGSAVNMREMFSDCAALETLDVSGFDTRNVEDMGGMFSGCKKLIALNVSGFDTAHVTDMSFMFNGCALVPELDVSGFDTGNVVTMLAMFQNCGALQKLDLSGFDTARVTDMGNMLFGLSALPELDVKSFDTSRVVSMRCMFAFSPKLKILDVSGFDTGNVTDMYGMFEYCTGLRELDVSGFRTGRVVDMEQMFYRCDALELLDLRGFDFTNVQSDKDMVQGVKGEVLGYPKD